MLSLRELSEALRDLVRPCVKIKRIARVVAHTCNPSAWEAETGGSQVLGQPQQFSEALCNLVRPCFEDKE